MVENYLIHNINNNNYEILILVASEAIYCLSNTLNKNEKDSNTNKLKECLNNELKINFENLIEIIDQFPDQIFNIIFLRIISDIEIENHSLKFTFIEKLTDKFLYIINNIKENDFENTNFMNNYFVIINNYLTGVKKFNINEIEDFDKILDLLFKKYFEKTNYDFSLQLINISTHYLININKINERILSIFKYLREIIDKEERFPDEIYEFLSQILVYIKNYIKNNDVNSINYKIDETLDIIMNLIKYTINLPDDYCLSNKKYSLLLFLKIFSFYHEKISYENLKYFFSVMNEVDKNIYGEKDIIEQILQISLAICSLAFIYLPEDIIIKHLDKIFKENVIKYPNLLFISLNNYNPFLIKRIILGICFFIKNKNMFNCLLQSEGQKKIFLNVFFKICFKLRIAELKKIKYLTKDDVFSNNNFVEEDDNINYENEKIITDDNDNDLDENLKDIFNSNENLIECDEYHCFYETMLWLKNNESELFNLFISSIKGNEIYCFNELINVRNVKVEYKGKEYLIPRKTVKIKRHSN